MQFVPWGTFPAPVTDIWSCISGWEEPNDDHERVGEAGGCTKICAFPCSISVFQSELSQVCNRPVFGRSGMTTSCAGTPRNMKMSHPSESPRSSSGGQTLSSTTSECERCGQKANPSLQIFSVRGIKELLPIVPPYLILSGRGLCWVS